MRLGDLDALYAKFEKAAWYNNADRDEVAETLLLDAPTIDAVPVVRCGKCMHADEKSPHGIICKCPTGGQSTSLLSSEDFCSCGEYKENK